MEFDAYGASLQLEDTASVARRVEELGFSGLWFTETQRPPFLSCAVASTVTTSIELGTAIAVAFPRSPMVPLPRPRRPDLQLRPGAGLEPCIGPGRALARRSPPRCGPPANR
jgi:hypothetical protein